MNDSLPPELCELEQLLSSLSPQSLSDETSGRFALACEMMGKRNDSDAAGLDELEKHLGEITPATMRTDLLSRMIKAMDGWHEHVPVEEKLVLFPDQTSKPIQTQPKLKGVFAAAAVALLGAFTAFMITKTNTDESGIQGVSALQDIVNTNNLSESRKLSSKRAWLAPDAMSHRVVNTSDRGVMMAGDQSLHRCIRLDSLETIRIQDEDGREITIDRPVVQYVLLPVQTN